MATRLLSEKMASGELTDIDKQEATVLSPSSVLNTLEVNTRIDAKMADGSVSAFFKGGTDPGDALMTRDEVDARIDSEAGVADRMRWMGPWDSTVTYEVNDVVTDAGWLMIANKQTMDRPAPQSVGEKKTEFLLPPTYVDGTFTGLVRTGHSYQIQKHGWIEQVEVFVPEVTGEVTYNLYMVDNTDPLTPIVTGSSLSGLLENQWNTVGVGSLGVEPGQEILFFIEALNSASSSQVTGPWTYDGLDQLNGPPTGRWNVNLQDTVLRINEVDDLSVNRQAALMAFVPGTTIEFRSQTTPTEHVTYTTTGAPVDQGTYIEYPVAVLSSVGSVTADEPCDMTADVPVAGVTRYSQDQNHWGAQGQPDWALMTGLHQEDGVSVPGAQDHAYGIRTTFQEAAVSPDWDAMSAPDRSAAGGGAGSAMAYFYDKQSAITVTGVNPTFTPLAQIAYNNAPPGVYEYRMSLSYTLNSTTTSAYVRFSIDGGNTWDTFQAEPKDITDTRPVYYAFPKEYANITDLDLQIEASKESGADTMVVTFVDAIIAQVR